MKKRALMAFPKLTATEEMKQIAASDMPRKEKTKYGYVTEVCDYYVYLRCVVQAGILKAALFFPDYLRLDGNNPVYEVYLDKENRQFTTYDCLNQKWSEAKLDRLDWKHWYAKSSWVSEEEAAVIQTYLDNDKRGASAILQFQRAVRDEQLVQRHRLETDPWDKDLEQVPELPKDWNRWVNKVAIQQNYIYYHYKKGGAKTGYCTYCEKEVPIKGHPHHNQEGYCSCCRHPVVFKAYGRAGYMQTEKYFAYLIQRCKDGFVVREFQADRTYRKESLPNSKLYCQEIRRTIYDRELKPRSYYWGMYKQRNMRWISCSPCSYDWHGAENGRVYGKTLPHLEKHELRCTGLVQWIRKQKSIDPESYLAVWRRLPQMEQIWKSGLSKLTKECFKNCDVVRQMILYPEAPRLIRALGLDSQGFNRLRQMDGDTEDLGWLQVEKKRGKPITNELLRWFRIHKIRAKDILFIVDRMSPLQICNYLQKQKKYFDGSLHNLSFIEDLELMAGNRILVSKRNMIIPHVEENLDRGGFSMVDTIPHVCPCCGQPTRIHESSGKGENGEDRIIKTLYCDNPDCETRRLKKFVHFVSQKAMDIEGLSEATLEKFIGQGFIHSYLDIYRLDRYRAEIVRMDGFGEKSWQRLWDAIQQSRNTTFERYLISMDIPMIGNTASKVLGRVFHYDLDEFRDAVYGGYDFRQLPDFGETLHNNIHDWFCVEDNFCIWEELQTMMSIQKPAVAEHSEDRVQDNPFVGKTIVVTGKVEPYTRDGINDLIESLGAHAGSSVSKKTDYLVCGENAGSKLSKARDLGVTVLSPAEFFSMAGAE